MIGYRSLSLKERLKYGLNVKLDLLGLVFDYEILESKIKIDK